MTNDIDEKYMEVNNGDSEEQSEKEFGCIVCQMTFATREEYERHMKKQHKDRN